MKKTMLVLAMLAFVFGFGTHAFAYTLPAIDGTLGAGEWVNQPYQYYLDVTDPNEAGITDKYDISHGVLFQEIDGFGFGDGNPANDGIYILLETYGIPPSLADAGAGDPPASISMNADFNGDGIIDLVIVHKAEFGPETLSYKRPVGSILGAPVGETPFGVEGINFKRGSVLEYYIPTGTGGTPHLPFPGSFVGTLVYDNGGDEPDDRVVGSLVPEPTTMFLFGSSLLGLLGVGRFGKK